MTQTTDPQVNFLDGVSTAAVRRQITTVSRACPYCRERTPDNSRGNCSVCERARDDRAPEEIPNLIYYPEGVAQVLQALDSAPLIAFDTETTSLRHASGRLHGVSLATNDLDWYVHGPALDSLLPNLSSLSFHPDKTWLAWNASFDLHFLIPYGFHPRNLVDVQWAAFLVDENQEMGLKYQSELHLGMMNLIEFKDLQKAEARKRQLRSHNSIYINDIPLSTLTPYAVRDARLTYAIWPVIERLLREEGMQRRFYEVEMPFLHVLEKMERRGVYLDLAEVARLTEDYTAQEAELRQRWDELTGGVNPGSHPQLDEYLTGTLKLKPVDFTPTGQSKLDELSLKRMGRKDRSGSIDLLLQLRQVSKIVSTYLQPLAELAYHDRIYTNFNRTRARTGRLASSQPNLQNIPIRTELGRRVRRCFIPTPGMVMLVVDYSQVELRIMAHYSEDELLTHVFMTEGDPHQMTADRLGIERYLAKTVNYLVSYMGSPSALVDEIEAQSGQRVSIRDAKVWLAGWWETYAGVKRWSERVINYAHTHGHVLTMGGRKRRLEEIDSPLKGIREAAERQAVNAPVQGSAADIIEDAMVEIDPIMEWIGGHMLLQVHDELVFEVPPEAVDYAAQQVQQVMQGIGDEYKLRIPLRADPGSGPSWGDAKH